MFPPGSAYGTFGLPSSIRCNQPDLDSEIVQAVNKGSSDKCVIAEEKRGQPSHAALRTSVEAGLHLEVNVGRRKPRAAWTWNSRYDPADADEPRQKSRMSPFSLKPCMGMHLLTDLKLGEGLTKRIPLHQISRAGLAPINLLFGVQTTADKCLVDIVSGYQFDWSHYYGDFHTSHCRPFCRV